MVRLAGIEPTTPWFVAKYSIQLSYSREAPNYSRTFLCISSERVLRDVINRLAMDGLPIGRSSFAHLRGQSKSSV
jgi:hypothetical protein